jgi:hypothetical protein
VMSMNPSLLHPGCLALASAPWTSWTLLLIDDFPDQVALKLDRDMVFESIWSGYQTDVDVMFSRRHRVAQPTISNGPRGLLVFPPR